MQLCVVLIVVIVCSVYLKRNMIWCVICFFFQAEDGIRDLVRSRGLGDVYKRQVVGKAKEELLSF